MVISHQKPGVRFFEGILKNLKPALKSTQDSGLRRVLLTQILKSECGMWGSPGWNGEGSFSEQKPSACESREKKPRMYAIKIVTSRMTTLPETNIASENGWLEYYWVLLGWPIFRSELLVSGRVDILTASGIPIRARLQGFHERAIASWGGGR